MSDAGALVHRRLRQRLHARHRPVHQVAERAISVSTTAIEGGPSGLRGEADDKSGL